MKKNFYSLMVFLYASTTHAQNADQLYFNQLTLNYDYVAASFVVDTPPPLSANKRAFLLWSRNYYPDSTLRSLSLDEFDASGNFLSEHANTHLNPLSENLVPKKIIRSQSFDGYYLLGYVINSGNLIGGLQVYSTPVVIKVDALLNLVWIAKLQSTVINSLAVNARIEYNDILEAANGELVLAGRYSSYYPGKINEVLVTRLKSSGSIIWNNHYTTSLACNAEALSVTEAADGSLALTGYITNCPVTTYAGPRQLLYMRVSSAGAPVFVEALNNGQEVSGDKIVKHTDTNGEGFFISGYIDVPTATGALNRQVLIVDLKETGSFVSVYHIGDAGTETAGDLIFKYLGGTNYSLYLTGSTNSYTSNIKSDVYYLQLNYSAGVMSLAEFSIFPATTSNYELRTGVEIKKAGKNRFAILENALYTVTAATSQTRNFTNVLVRDLDDLSGSCIKQFLPPVTRYTLNINQYALGNTNPGFTLYPENYGGFLKVYPKPQCGTLFIDAPNAGTVPGNPDQVTRQAITTPLSPATTSGALRVYPNPVKDRLYINYGTGTGGQVQVKIYSAGMQLVKQQEALAGGTIAVSVNDLAAGVYFVRVEGKAGTPSFTIRKE